MNWTKRPNIKTCESCKTDRTDCDEAGLHRVIELGEAELSHVSGGVSEAGIVHRF
jgi:hypothetical protein